MTIVYRLLICGCILLFVGCSALTMDINVQAERDAKVDISGYKTFSWLGSAQIVYDPEGKWEPRELDMDSEIKWLIERELRDRGFIQTAKSPDLYIGYAAGVDMTALELVENPDKKMTMLHNKPKGAMTIVFVDASTGYPIWIAAAEGDVQEDTTPDNSRKRLDYAVKKMFKLLPR